VKLHFSRLESSFSNIWDNKTSILLSKKKTKQGRVCSINTFYTDSYGQKRKFPMILLPKKKQVHQDSDTDYGYQKMKTALQIIVITSIIRKYID
jgi:hypothetical protein